jgi:hypothetical protein
MGCRLTDSVIAFSGSGGDPAVGRGSRVFGVREEGETLRQILVLNRNDAVLRKCKSLRTADDSTTHGKFGREVMETDKTSILSVNESFEPALVCRIHISCSFGTNKCGILTIPDLDHVGENDAVIVLDEVFETGRVVDSRSRESLLSVRGGLLGGDGWSGGSNVVCMSHIH